MIQWIAVAIIIALCLLFVCRRLARRSKGGPCCNCNEKNCPSRRNRNEKP